MESNEGKHTSVAPCIIPLTEKDITSQWIFEATGLLPVENTVHVTANIQDGVGFLSNLCRVSFQTESGNENILVKLLPSNPDFKELTMSQHFDEREINTYTQVLPQITQVAPLLKPNLCQYYSGRVENHGDTHTSMLIIEDLKPAGYQMYNPESENWDENLQKLLTFLAHFHAAGVTLEGVKGKKISNIYPFLMVSSNPDNDNDRSFYTSLMQLGHANYPHLLSFLKHNKVSDELYISYETLGDHFDEVFTKVSKVGGQFACLLHGDVWPPNVMVANDPELPLKIIDWQTLCYRDPAFELSIVLLTCLPVQHLSVESFDKFIEMYHRLFVAAAGSSLMKSQKRSGGELIKFFNKWAIRFSFMWFLMSPEIFSNEPERFVKLFELLHESYQVTNVLFDTN